MELIADECFTGYMRRGQGSIKHFCCACVCMDWIGGCVRRWFMSVVHTQIYVQVTGVCAV